MNILAPLAAGIALTPLATKTLGQFARGLSFSNLFSAPDSQAQDTKAVEPTVSARPEISAFQDELTQRLTAAGIELKDPVVLGINSWGEIEVRSPHLQVSDIERLLNGDPEVVQRFHTLAMTSASESTADGDKWSAFNRFEITIG